jgi:type IX secretion system PorP/SprF family membrane protein
MIPGTSFDPILSNDRHSKLSANAGAGFFLYSRRAYVGFSVPHVFRSYMAYHPPYSNSSLPQPELRRNYLLNAGMVFGMESSVKFKPTVLVKWTEGTMPQVDLNLQALLSNRLWCGAGYRTGGTLIAMAELQLSPKLKAGYAFDYALHPHLNGAAATHEINLGFDLRSKADPLKNPRYF